MFLSRPWNFYFERKVSKYFRKRNVCHEILFSLFTQSSFIHTSMITFHSWKELTIFICLVIDITVLNHVLKYWKSAHNYVVSKWGKIRWRRWTRYEKEKNICLDETMVKKPSTYKYIPKYISGTTLKR